MSDANPQKSSPLINKDLDDLLYKYRQLIRQEQKREVLNGERQDIEQQIIDLINREVVAELEKAWEYTQGVSSDRIADRIAELNQRKAGDE